MKIVSVIGARPQFIKAAPLSLALRREHEEYLIHTGQHYDDNMSEVFFRELGIPEPDAYLGVGSGSHASQTGAMLSAIESVLIAQRPDTVLVYGDTNSTLAGALAAAKLGIPVAHVEAGLRSFNRSMPEEINRVTTDHLSQWLFAPSQQAVDQLAKEGITEGVHQVGDVMADSVRLFGPRAAEHSKILERLRLTRNGYAVATVHRASNTDSGDRLRVIIEELTALELPVILPLHPRTRAAMLRHHINLAPQRSSQEARLGREPLTFIEPLGYLDMLQLQRNAAVILTDSGGLQKEAYYLGVPCVTLREETEWLETIHAGWNRLAPPGASVSLAVESAITGSRQEPRTVYGSAESCERIAQVFTVHNSNA